MKIENRSEDEEALKLHAVPVEKVTVSEQQNTGMEYEEDLGDQIAQPEEREQDGRQFKSSVDGQVTDQGNKSNCEVAIIGSASVEKASENAQEAQDDADQKVN